MTDASIRSKKVEGPPPQAVLWALQNRPNPICLDSPNGRTLISFSAAPPLTPGGSFEEAIRSALESREGADGHPFAGGVMGYVSYESGRFFEQMPEARGPLPLQEFGLRRYEGSMVFEEGRWWIAGTESFVEAACELVLEAGQHQNHPQQGWGYK
ncbi:MAG: hypothetical protein VXW32_10410, partial [Myxococcota bacterium]|nr:hypothetical protein [Myxococcota bacterium]